MRDEIDHPSNLGRLLLRFPVAFRRLLNPSRELQKQISLVKDKERKRATGTDNQPEDKHSHKFSSTDGLKL